GAASLTGAVRAARPLRGNVRALRRRRARAPAPRGCDGLDTALPAVAPRTREHQQVDARAGDPLPRLAAGADLGFGLARVRTVSADRALGARRSRAARRPHRRHELLPRHRDALPALRAPARAATYCNRSISLGFQADR